MISCERCKTENLEGSQYCDECGAPLRPNFRSNAPGSGGMVDADNNNGSHAANKQPEFASGSAAGINFASSLGSGNRATCLACNRAGPLAGQEVYARPYGIADRPLGCG